MRNAKLYGRTFNWEDLPEEVARRGVSRKAYASDEVMLVRNVIDVGLEVRPHAHDDFDQLVLIVEGRCNFFVSGVPHPMGPGDLRLVPAGAEHYIDVLEGPCVNLDVFVPPREDYAHLLSYLDAEA
ncbi:MAG: cupin domain-containing protein [Actinomycetota bacterium]|nr:cupin domain-containing protein [Actinomycetota bacterium]